MLSVFRISSLSGYVCFALLAQLAFIIWWFTANSCELFAEPGAGAFTRILVDHPPLILVLPAIALLLTEVDGLRMLSRYATERPLINRGANILASALKGATYLWVAVQAVSVFRFLPR